VANKTLDSSVLYVPRVVANKTLDSSVLYVPRVVANKTLDSRTWGKQNDIVLLEVYTLKAYVYFEQYYIVL
jgi:hypothetical protein